LIYISYAELAKDVTAWSYQLPRDIDAFIGIARSGIIPASMLALHRNVKLGTVEDFCDGRIFRGGYRDQHRIIKKVMVVDDSSLSGKSLDQARDTLINIKQIQTIYGAVYVQPGIEVPGRYYYRTLTIPRLFEWNWLHHFWLGQACMDIDGVLCRDPTKEENDDNLRYRKFLHTVEPFNLPTVEVHTLITGRLEKYRQDTVRWLKRWNIKYKNLIMHPAPSAKERRIVGDHAKRKAQVYSHPGYKLFVESSQRQAEIIHAKTKKPVLCTDTGQFFA